MEKWYESPMSDAGVVISSRVRLARNLRRYPFSVKIDAENANMMINEIKNSAEPGGFEFLPLDGLEKRELAELMEHHLISMEMMMKSAPKALLKTPDESAGIMLNEEDHVRIQAIFPGDNLQEAYRLANRIDDLIDERAGYAFDPEFGYLTSCPTNTGTGLRASLMLHLPALTEAGLIRQVIQGIGKFGFTARGLHGEGSEPMACVYQISNQVTLGKSENEILDGLQSVAARIAEQEISIAERLVGGKKKEILDKVYRSYGILKYARTLTLAEGLSLLSDLRFGFLTGLISEPKPEKTIYNLMVEIQPGCLLKRAGGEAVDLDAARAEFLRNSL